VLEYAIVYILLKKGYGREAVWELLRHKLFASQEPDLLQCGIQNKHIAGRLPQASSSDSCRAARIGLQLHRYLIPVGSEGTLGLLLVEPLHFRHQTESVSASLYEVVTVKALHLSMKLFSSLPHPNKHWIPPNLISREEQVVLFKDADNCYDYRALVIKDWKMSKWSLVE